VRQSVQGSGNEHAVSASAFAPALQNGQEKATATLALAFFGGALALDFRFPIVCVGGYNTRTSVVV
jgi:hypothetical protein